MKENFEKSLPLVLVHEGGYSDHPKDPGGATNKGITHKTYDAWRKGQGQDLRSVRYITDDEIAEIYRGQYWNKVSANDLPSGVDYAVFDFAVNSGPSRAAKFLQKVVGVPADGIIGAQTLAAVNDADPSEVVRLLCAERLAWLKRLKTFSTFGRGWTRRVNDVAENAASMVHDGEVLEPKTAGPGRADGAEKAAATVTDLAKSPKAWTAATALLGSMGGILQGTGPVQWALAAAIIVGVAAVAFHLIRGRGDA